MDHHDPDRPLDAVYDAALVDLDGVLYVGGTPVPTAASAVDKARGAGMRVAFVTNNASRTPGAVAERLCRMGVGAAATEVVTSAQAAARLVADRVGPDSPVLVVGDTGLRAAVRERGLRPVSTAAEGPVAVVQGYSPRISYDLLAAGALAVTRGALFVAANGDATVPTAHGLLPGNGSLIQVISHATGHRPLIAGKPEPPLHEEGVARTRARRPLVIGDRLDTDIEGAHRRGAHSLLVLSGVTTPRDLLFAPPHRRPTYLAEDVSGLNTVHPRPRTGGSEATCRGWTAVLRDGRLRLTGTGDRIDALRALCAAAWADPQGVDPTALGETLAQLDGPSSSASRE